MCLAFRGQLRQTATYTYKSPEEDPPGLFLSTDTVCGVKQVSYAVMSYITGNRWPALQQALCFQVYFSR